MKARFLIFLLLLANLAGCQNHSTVSNDSKQPDENLTVSAAISLKDAFGEIGALYKSKTGKTINYNFGASGALQKQIETGAPVDVFASAGEKQMDELAAKNLINVDSRRDFARNKLILIAPKNSGEAIISDFKKIITDSSVKKIAVGNPKTVPAGQYADEAFEKLNLKKDLQSKLIFAEDVRQVVDYVARGEVEFGIVYESDALNAFDKVDSIVRVPEDSHSPILYPIALIKDGKQKSSAKEFVDLVLSAEGQNILRRYGFSALSEPQA